MLNMVVFIQKRVHVEYWIRIYYRLFFTESILSPFNALIYRVCDIFSLFLGMCLGEVAVDRISKGTHMEQSISPGLEADNEDRSRKQTNRKMGYPIQDPVKPKERASVLSNNRV